MFSYDKPGAAHQNVNALASYAYRLYISYKYKLSLGLGAGIMNRSYNPNKLNLDIGNDPGMVYEKENSLRADFSAGAELTSDHLTVGLGIVHLGNNDAGTIDDSYSQQQIYTYAHYHIPLTYSLDIVPAASWLHYDNGNLFEFGASSIYDQK